MLAEIVVSYASAREVLTWPSSCRLEPRENIEDFAVIFSSVSSRIPQHGSHFVKPVLSAFWQETNEDFDG